MTDTVNIQVGIDGTGTHTYTIPGDNVGNPEGTLRARFTDPSGVDRELGADNHR